ncbi:hypothetical protein J3A83DRAFT_3576019 [Scleroderma citrinum]
MASLVSPPYYLLISHNTLQQSVSAQCTNVLAHADVEYHYADDSPLALFPHHPDEHVLVLYHDPDNTTNPTIRSTSGQFAVSGVNVLPAPGAGADEEDANRNTNMYVLRVTSTADDQYVGYFCIQRTLNHDGSASLESSQAYAPDPQTLVARFKHR